MKIITSMNMCGKAPVPKCTNNFILKYIVIIKINTIQSKYTGIMSVS